MKMMDKVSKGKLKKPLLALIYGPDGVGKTSFGADAPNPIFIGKEDGACNLDVSRFPEPGTYDDIITALRELYSEKHDYKTVVVDSLDWIEPMVWKAVCEAEGVNSIEKVGGGYGKGYLEAQNYWGHMMHALRVVRAHKDMNVIVLAHSQVKAFNDPTQPNPYDRYQLKLNEKASALWREFVDFVGFANFEVYTKADKSGRKAKAFGDGRRILYTERRPSFDAKNRLGLPFEMPLSFAEFEREMNKGDGEGFEEISENIKELSELVTGEKKKSLMNAVKDAGKDTEKLSKILNHLRFITANSEEQ